MRGDLTRLGRGVHPLRSVGFLLLDSLLDSSIDLTGDRDAGVLLDPIIFGPFNRSYASMFNKTSRLRSLDGFNMKIQKGILYFPSPDLHICIVRTCVFRVFCVDCSSSRVPAGRGVHWLAVDVPVPVVCDYLCLADYVAAS